MAHRRRTPAIVLALSCLTPACDGSQPDLSQPDPRGAESTPLFPDVVAATASIDSDGSWTFAVTISSPYDSPDRYADGWRVIGPDGTVYGIHTLLHDHADEQPFTRRQRGVSIPATVATVTIEGRDQVSGFGGATAEVDLAAVRAAP